MIKVIMSCDDNSYYLDFWHHVSKIWKEYIGFSPVLVHIGNRTDISSEYGEVHHILPDESLPIHTQAQLARLWYPTQEPDILWITSDIDMFPLSKTYWNEVIMDWFATKPDWSNLNSTEDYFPICYHVALGKMFTEVLGIDKESFSNYVQNMVNNDKEKSVHTPENWTGAPMSGWNMDEIVTSKKIVNFRNLGGVVHQPKRIDNRRLCRSSWRYEPNLISSSYYIDCHSLRPYDKYKNEIQNVLEML